jgi:hypothetical protein
MEVIRKRGRVMTWIRMELERKDLGIGSRYGMVGGISAALGKVELMRYGMGWDGHRGWDGVLLDMSSKCSRI